MDVGEVGGGAAVEDYFVKGVVDGELRLRLRLRLRVVGVVCGRGGGGDGDFQSAAQEHTGAAVGPEGFP